MNKIFLDIKMSNGSIIMILFTELVKTMQTKDIVYKCTCVLCKFPNDYTKER